VIEAAAVDLPGFAAGPFGQALALLQAQVQVDEIERAADPGDPRDDVKPADREIHPLK
jgi:hypothetical protein